MNDNNTNPEVSSMASSTIAEVAPLRGVASPEQIFLPPTEYCPNSPLPVLIYRQFFSEPVDPMRVKEHIEACSWVRSGPIWKATKQRHFHPNVHECYAVLSGTSKLLYGVGHADIKGPVDPNNIERGYTTTLYPGDVIVNPAGTGHSNILEEGKYEYLAFFPDGSPHWRSPRGDKLIDLATIMEETLTVPMPLDPVVGKNGHLQKLWTAALARHHAGGEYTTGN